MVVWDEIRILTPWESCAFSNYAAKFEDSLQVFAITKYLFLKQQPEFGILGCYRSFRQILEPNTWIHPSGQQINLISSLLQLRPSNVKIQFERVPSCPCKNQVDFYSWLTFSLFKYFLKYFKISWLKAHVSFLQGKSFWGLTSGHFNAKVYY